MSSRVCHVLFAISLVGICIGVARVSWHMVMYW